MKRILITGGAGFVGSNLALGLRSHFADAQVYAFDNLKRRGSELSLKRLKEGGVTFIHGDVRCRNDFDDLPKAELLIDCAAEPSVLAGVGESPLYVIDTNLLGTINCLDYARRSGAGVIFLSTSRVYPVEGLSAIQLTETETRFEIARGQEFAGISERGISERFPLQGARSLYGASKLASELLLQEFVASYATPAVINRCGVLTGPWQMGKVDQGVIVLWVARHIFRKSLSYIGYGGLGKQVRDILHVRDLLDLLITQIKSLESFRGEVFNVGGGRSVSLSLRELTALCREITGSQIEISSVPENRTNDIPLYLSDCSKAEKRLGWAPKVPADEIVGEIARWINDNRRELEPILS